jgi:hypothetical protein
MTDAWCADRHRGHGQPSHLLMPKRRIDVERLHALARDRWRWAGDFKLDDAGR